MKILRPQTLSLNIIKLDWSYIKIATVLFVFVTWSLGTPKLVQAAPLSDAWLEDFAQLKHEMSDHYANLEWAVDDRRMDLKQLSQDTESRLRRASHDIEARFAIQSFISAFGDGHLHVDWPAAASKTADVQVATIQQPISSRLGFHHEELTPGIEFTKLDCFRELSTADSKFFTIGVLSLPNGKKLGLLRIAIFNTHCFPDLCDIAVDQLGLKKDDPCDGICSDHINIKVADLLTAAMERQLRALKDTGIDALLVDITGNGGGNDWVEPAARVLSSKPLRSPRFAFIRHEHWAKQFAKRIADLETDAQRAQAGDKVLMMQAIEIYRKALSEAQLPTNCDRLWTNQKVIRPLVAKEPVLYSTGTVAYLRHGEPDLLPANTHVFYPSQYAYHEGTYSGPLIILVDERTGSASEYFASMFADNNAATVIGTPTAGAGSGYTNGGIISVLKNSGAQIKMPDCVRYRADGSNEVAGFTPKVLIPWHRHDSPFQKADRVLKALTEVFPKSFN